MALDAKDLAAIADYTGPGYSEINAALRSGKPLTSEMTERIASIDASLDKLPKYEGIVYRGTDLPPNVLAKYRSGATVTEDSFTSTSASKSAAFTGNVRFKIFSRTGRSVSAYSQYPSEDEVLFKHGTKFVVRSRSFDLKTGETVITMIEVQ